MDSFAHRRKDRSAHRSSWYTDTQHSLIRKAGAAFCCLVCLWGTAYGEAPTVGESDKRALSLHVSQAPAVEVLRGLAELTGQNVVLAGDIQEKVSASLDDVTPEEAFAAILASAGLVARQEGSTWVVFGHETANQVGISARSYRLSYGVAKEVAESLKHAFSDHPVNYNEGANTVIITGTPRELMQADTMIRALDQPEKQVKVEAEVVAVNKSYAKELGIDWDFKSLTGSATYSRDSWSEQRYVTDDTGNIKYDEDGNPRVRNVYHNGWDVKVPDGYAGISYGKSAAGHPYTFFFQAKLNALVSEGKAKVLARPHVVTMNGRKAEILIGSQIPVIVEHMDNGVKTTTTEYKDAGIKLTYTPVISAEGDITADVQAEVSTPYLVPEMKAYRIVTRAAHTRVRLPSGGTLRIGGLIDKEEGKTFRKVPILGDIPLIGKLFQSHSKSNEESEVVIVIRAEIVDEKSSE